MKILIKILSFFVPLLFLQNLASATAFKQDNLPDVVKKLIRNQQKSCHEIKGPDGKPGVYNIGNSIKKISYINHNLEYIVHKGEDEICSSTSTFSKANGGFYLTTIFNNYNNKWQKIYNGLVYDYVLATPKSLDTPTNIIIRVKGYPGNTTDEIELEWDNKNNSYFQKNIRKDTYNLYLPK